MAVLATQEIRRMRGGAQSHLMLASDGKLYVVKFQNNPQHTRVLANELLATRLGAAIGLTVPHCDVIEVTEWLIRNTPELSFELKGGSERCRAGLQFGSELVGGLMPGHVVDYLPEHLLLETRNLAEFAGMLALDKWTCNVNGRQAVFHKSRRERRYRSTFIDQGYCFHAGEWKFVDAPLRGVFAQNSAYRGVIGWKSFEPWLSRIEALSPTLAWEIAGVVPPEWYGGDLSVIEALIEQLLARRGRVRDLIVQFRDSSRNPFPNWGKGEGTEVRESFPEPEWVHDMEADKRVI